MSIIKNIPNETSEIDSIKIEIEGIEFNIYGILHGITGGNSQDYIVNVNKAIQSSPGKRFCEKSMKKLYKGLDIDLRDWMVFSSKEAFNFCFKSIIQPRFMYALITTALREKHTQKDNTYGKKGVHSLSDIATSMSFHALEPKLRRELCGFPSPEEYLKLNVLRREESYKYRMRFPDKNWVWLEYIEPNACIPLRSIHMIEFAIAYCKKHELTQASLFVGEIHNSDIEWYAGIRNNPPEFASSHIQEIKNTINKAINNSDFILSRLFRYMTTLTLGAVFGLMPYILAYGYLIWGD